MTTRHPTNQPQHPQNTPDTTTGRDRSPQPVARAQGAATITLPADAKVQLWSYLAGWLPSYLDRPESFNKMAQALAASLMEDVIAEWRSAAVESHAHQHHEAVHAVLDLTPPEMHPGDDSEMHALLTEGWNTCYDTVRRTITEALQANAEDAPPREPRVWKHGDPEPTDRPPVRDSMRDVWTWNPLTGLWETPETIPMTWDRITKKFSPLTEVLP